MTRMFTGFVLVLAFALLLGAVAGCTKSYPPSSSLPDTNPNSTSANQGSASHY